MFTGIIEKTGVIKDLSLKGDTRRLNIFLKDITGAVKRGDSIAVNGVCLTVVNVKGDLFSFDLMEESFKNTSFRYAKKGDAVNIERALAFGSRLEGHFVSGHVDGIRKIKSIKLHDRPRMDISIGRSDKKYAVEKSSVAIDGISLTIAEAHENTIRLCMIPYTIRNTNLKLKKEGQWVNMEFDILAKYVQGLNQKTGPGRLTEELLKSKGFI